MTTFLSLNKNLILRILISFLFLFGIFHISTRDVQAATYYIDASGGSDSNNGTTTGTAWQNLSKASASPVTSGDTILLKRGETWIGQTLTPIANTTIDAYGSGAKPIINGNSAVARCISITANNVSVSNITVRGATSSMVFVGATGAILSDIDSIGNPIAFRINSGTATLNRVTSSGASNAAYFFENSSVTTINTATSTTTTTGNGFRAITSSQVTCNNCTASGSIVDGFSLANSAILNCNKCSAFNNGSTSDSTSGDGYTSHDTSVMNIRYSIAYGNYKSGVAATGASSGEVLNSTFYNNVQSTFGSGWDSSGDLGIGINATGTWTIKNNITYGHPVEFMISAVAVAGGGNVNSDYNNFYDSLGGNAFDYSGTFSNFATYKTNSGKDANSLNLNPVFQNIATNNFKLQSSSSVINMGTNVSLTSDYISTSVPQGSSVDMGAYEFLIPSPAATLTQYKSDGSTIISTGSSTNETTVVLTFDMFSTNDSDSLTPQVEIQPIGNSFTNTPTNSGSAVVFSGSSVQGTVTISGLVNGTAYHWQARVHNSAGNSTWTSYGGNAESATDFSVSVPTPTPTATLTITPTSTLSLTPTPSIIISTQTQTPTPTLTNTPIPTTTIAPTSSPSSSQTNSSCSDEQPTAAPDLFQLDRSDKGDEITIYYTPVNPSTYYYISYSEENNAEKYGVQVDQTSTGVMSFTIAYLNPNDTYFIKVRGGNGCMPGPWSSVKKVLARNTAIGGTTSITDENSATTNEPTSKNPENNEKKNQEETTPNSTQSNTTTESSKTENAEVMIKVIDENQKAVQGAKVTIHSKVQTGVTDKDGIITFKNVEKGDHKVLIAYENYEGEEQFKVEGDTKKYEVVVNMKRSGFNYMLWGIIATLLVAIFLLWRKSKKNLNTLSH